MWLRVIAVGRDRKGLFQRAVEDYSSRLCRYLRFEVIEVPASKLRRADAARREEADRIVSVHGERRRLFSLDGGGEALSSAGLARLLDRLILESRGVDFVIGGDEGLDPSISRKAEKALSLGPMTLPHQLARVVLVEQLYRAMTILRGEPYHK